MRDVAEARNFNKNSPWYFTGLSILIITIWNIPNGFWYLYPFTIIATYFHEMGHGLAAFLLGADFKYLVINPDGSGVAVHSGAVYFGRFGYALIAIAGPLGPTIAGMLLVLASSSQKATKSLLLVLGVFIIISVIIWVRSVFGVIFLVVLGLLLIIIGAKANDKFKQFMLQLMGVSAMLSLYQSVGYFFMESAEINGEIILSDTGYLQKYLWLPHWFWAVLIIGISIWAFYFSFRHLFKKNKGL